MCVTGHALLSALVKRVREGYEPTDEDRANLVKTGCTRDEIDRAIEEAVRGRAPKK